MARSLKQRVASGAKFLDKKVPGWEKKVKRTKLVMCCNEMCVLGQLAGDQMDALKYGDSLGLDMCNDDYEKYGFEGDDYAEDKSHEELWQNEIKARLGVAEKKSNKKGK